MQPTPNFAAEDVSRIATRDFASDANVALKVLARYGAESWQRERHRVQLAILKIADGDFDRLTAATETACGDYRDILTAAEYATYAALATDELDDEEAEKQAECRDLEQYNQWLRRQ